MRKNLIDLIQFLIDRDTKVTGREVASSFDLNIRTIQNYIREINGHYPNLIISNSFGYSIPNTLRAREIIVDFKRLPKIPENNDERGVYIIKKILISKSKNIRIYDMIDQLGISLSTFNNVINRIKKQLKKYNLKINRSTSTVTIVGNEKNKRRLIGDIIFSETSNGIIINEEISHYFGDNILETAIDIITFLTNNRLYSINDYVYQNVLLHLCVLLFRVQEGNKSNQFKDYILSQEDMEALNPLLEIIFKRLQIELNVLDQIELIILVKTKFNYKISYEDESIYRLIDKKNIKIVNKIIQDVENTYNINLNTDAFRIPFALHLQNLMFRIDNNNILKNTSTSLIKESYPLIYDISVHIAQLIDEYTKYKVVEDEISFITLHIGAEIERQKVNESKIRTVFIVEKYLDIQKRLVDELNEYFSNELEIVSVNNGVFGVENWEGVELVISTTPQENYTSTLRGVHFVQIPTFSVKDARYTIFEAINEINRKDKLKILADHFDYFFKPTLFLCQSEISNRDEVINTMCKSLRKQGYVSDTFIQRILDREKVASTAFGTVAVPHQFIEPSFKSGIHVLLSPNGIKWGSNTVNIVLLVSITTEDKYIFKQLYEALLSFFEYSDFIHKICNVDNFDEFKTEMNNFINENN